MAHACPSCGMAEQVVKLDHFYLALPDGSGLKSSFAPPATRASSYGVPLVVAAVGAFFVIDGAVVLGLLLLLVAAVLAMVVSRGVDEARRARAHWERQMFCRHCAIRFVPEEPGG
ncbi:hypothetical protein [Streptacidiphilus jiangxiensis]|uniref:Uncharacterized protein n=1 Tax=Streptacidiphilus jiangxiensis TaxID=235985 RepID=A0A1H7S8I6_STRJI|nr:hypothetical protein [Streptacidiphilus jiangxiensis]SEL68619.1 hypothetical protein SAMN05414137_111211 [Streptacidiphilus jiangxiensis]